MAGSLAESRGHEIYCYDPEIVRSNLSWVELGVSSPILDLNQNNIVANTPTRIVDSYCSLKPL